MRSVVAGLPGKRIPFEARSGELSLLPTIKRTVTRAANRSRQALTPLLWRKVSVAPAEVLLREVSRPFRETRARISDARVAAVFEESNRTVDHVEHFTAFEGPFTVEPRSGFLLTPEKKIVRESIVYDHASIYPRWSARPQRKVDLDEVVLFDHFWGTHYFHFYSDVLQKLHLLDRFAARFGKLPLVISRRSYESKWFSFFRRFGWASERSWWIQEEDTSLTTRRAWLLQPMPYRSDYWLGTQQVVKSALSPMNPARRLFVNRPAGTGRYVDNVEQLRPVLERYGFEFVELEGLSMDEQVKLFSSASVIVTMHGAALTNLIYSSPSTRVLEFVPQGDESCHYYWVSQIMGLAHYDALLGGPLRRNRLTNPRGCFSVNPAALDLAIGRLLAAEPWAWLGV